jgi:hypothetical protein
MWVIFSMLKDTVSSIQVVVGDVELGECSDSFLDDDTGLCFECDEEKAVACSSGKRQR